MSARGFFSSFENTDPPLTWIDGVDVDANNAPRAAGATMSTREGGGPAKPYTARPGVGFTGRRALRYQGNHPGRGPAYVVNRLFLVDLLVSRDTVLEYVLLPELLGDDLRYPSTFVAVDLAFDDGSRLSDLGLADQLGFALTPRGQGESKALSPNQWNRRFVRIGGVAEGKIVTTVLLGYDNPAGPARFAGWVDDIAIVDRPRPEPRRPVDHVITTRGTSSVKSYSRGNTFPATAVPHGFNFWTPVTDAARLDWIYSYARHNNDRNLPAVQAFAVSHQPSPWLGDRQTFHVLPSAAAGKPRAGRRRRALTFRHNNEIARPHHYGVRFTNGIRVDIAPADHAAILRFTFPGEDANLVFDNVTRHGGLTLDPVAGTVSGYSDVRSGLSEGAGRMFVHATFDRRIAGGGKLRRGLSRRVTGYLRFEPDPDGETVVTMRIATSLISLAQARRNLWLEIADDDTFDTVRERAARQWDDILDRVEVDGASDDQLTTLYSNLYRLFLYPNSGHENTGTTENPSHAYASPFAKPAKKNTPTQTGAALVQGRIYVNNGFWDTYRTAWPAYALLDPARCAELVNGFLQQYTESGWVARWSSPGHADLMTGTSSDAAFADAHLKGVPGIDLRAAYEAALRNATVAPPDDTVGRKGLDRSIFLGYTPDTVRHGLAWTLDGCVNDFAIANLAAAVGDRDNHGYFLDRARAYVRSFDPNTGFFQGRRKGNWRQTASQYDPRAWGGDYVETNGWNTAFSVPHDGAGLAALLGGPAALAARLDEFFATQETGRARGAYWRTIHEMPEARDVRMGQYAHSNQPSHHIIYLYAYAGALWRTQEKVREVLSRLYAGSEVGQGYPGDEDNGEMSAWWLFGALGLYPLRVGSPEYVIGSPLFRRMSVRVGEDATLVVNAPNNSPTNVYVQGLMVNGTPWEKAWLPHEVVARGAVLDFQMGPEPSRWACGPDAAPPSLTPPGTVPRTMVDITADPGGHAEGSDGVAVAALFDDTSRTQVTFRTPAAWVGYRTSGAAAGVAYYTLTSGTGRDDPRSWALRGSNDGVNWTVLDERSRETFRWRRQTRAFAVANPGQYTHYRLDVTENTGTPTTTLAQLELLAR
ncbi:GH92 family glycosyl hydrolase [Actinophytocola gossypii]|uniref:GH92 family glycosyl hydrolase n=1 Tax=Actinophytocola gossypii TaxID=2812003 RepID=A0ABT2J1I2_9PSEU|nr:GH92 family glycosyl hydrolase [Actinophytocola gossypii]MCT2581722.1 GH92 family glycosyl hydrolase [Actinophytocola gossypii]